MTGKKELPDRDELRSYDYAVAGHAGTMCDAAGELFIKPCTQSEIDFYQSAQQHDDLVELMPTFVGSLALSDTADIQVNGVNGVVAGLISETGDIKTSKDQIAASVAEEVAAAVAAGPTDEVPWIPNRGRKINTNKSVVLENATHGFKKPNVLDVKLGVRLWADDAPAEKKRRFDKISSETTHGSLGFRIAGMRVYRGSDEPAELDDEGYKIYDKDYGRVSVSDDNVVDALRRFVFNDAADIDAEDGRAICEAFAQELDNAEQVISQYETRMYSSSLLFVFEGDGKALREAIDADIARAARVGGGNVVVGPILASAVARTTKRIDSGIVLEDEDSDEEGEGAPLTHTLKLIDFAHAQWTPGQGPDENTLTGVRSLARIFKDLAQ